MSLNWKHSLALLGLSIIISPELSAQSLTNGCGWKMNINGHTADLCINASSGVVSGSMTSNGTIRQIMGFWDGAARRIMFQAPLQNDPKLVQYYEGFLSYDNVSNTAGPKRFTGTFVFFTGTGATPVVNQLGWTAVRP